MTDLREPEEPEDVLDRRFRDFRDTHERSVRNELVEGEGGEGPRLGDGTQGLVVTSTGYSPSERDGFNEVRRKGVVIAQVFPSGEHVPQGSQGQGEGPRPAGTTSQPPLPPSVAVQHLTPQKARILLMLALTKTRDPREVQRFFDEY